MTQKSEKLNVNLFLKCINYYGKMNVSFHEKTTFIQVLIIEIQVNGCSCYQHSVLYFITEIYY